MKIKQASYNAIKLLVGAFEFTAIGANGEDVTKLFYQGVIFEV